MIFKRVLVGLSGGIDSAVSAYLLQKKGFEVIGCFMKNWNDLETGETDYCTSDKDYEDARIIANKLKIKLLQINYSKEYWLNIFSNFVKEYEQGLTPNPDILCNRIIKFDLFLKYGLEKLKCDAIATGHYVRTSFGDFLEHYDSSKSVKLLEAVDTFKDQTFFLSQVDQSALKRVMFPLGSMKKTEVKEIARSIGFDNIARKNESTGLCFVGRRSFPDFISQFIPDKPGKFIHYESGKVLGEHLGIHYWTIGQRTKLWDLNKNFVYRKDPVSNIIFTVSGTQNPLLFSDIFFTENPFWISENPLNDKNLLKCEFRFQHTKPKVNCVVYKANSSGSKLLMKLDTPLRAITPGQYAVLYKDGECLGSSRITDPGTCSIIEKIN